MCGTYEVLVTKASKPCSEAATLNGSEARTNGAMPRHHDPAPVITLDQGDPLMYEAYWKKVGPKCSVTMSGSQSMSYFGDGKTLCWYMDQKLEEEIRRLHKVAGNAVVDGRHVVIGTGSSQLIMAALFAVAETLNLPHPADVVSAAPYYSCYPEMINYLRTGLFKWAGDARVYKKDGPYIELVTSPNNPDGSIREAVVNGGEGFVVHDLAYYWPQYTAMTSAADHDVMLFTASKCTGHAGSRIGWAIVRDENVARKMVKFIEINTIGVSKESQARSASVMEAVSLSCGEKRKPCEAAENFFEHSQRKLGERWKRLREVVKKSHLFHLPKFPARFCKFRGEVSDSYPAFAWMKYEEGTDGEQVMRENRVRIRSGRRFGCGAEYVRISMLSRDEEFDLFLQRLSAIQASAANANGSCEI